MIVDVVTTRRFDLHAELLAQLEAELPRTLGALSAASYRPLSRGDEAEGELQAWPAALELGRPLPTLPLWLRGELSVPLDLEASHRAACQDLRIKLAG